MDRLDTASPLLKNALDEYLHACLDVQSSFSKDSVLDVGNSENLGTRLTNELSLLNSYYETISRAKSAVARSRNQMLSQVPIHRLPAEILMKIFRKVVYWEETVASATPGAYKPKAAFLKYPDLLSRVCFRWRAIAIACPELWTYITFSWWPEDQQLSITRASARFDRAGQLPLKIHHVISGAVGGALPEEWLELISTTTSRACSIEIRLDVGTVVGYAFANLSPPSGSATVLDLCLHTGTPGILERVAIEVKNSRMFPAGHGLLETPGTVGPNQSFSTFFNNHEPYWKPISALVLTGFYPHWASLAYHGLVELRLTPEPEALVTISELQLSAILISSPSLQVLELKIPITGRSSDHLPTTPTRLNDLQVVITTTPGLLQLLAPGTRDLSLFITNGGDLSINGTEVKDFVARARVTELHVYRWNNYSDIMAILSRTPYIRTLGLNHSIHFVDSTLPPTNIYLETLILLSNSSLYLQNLTDFVQKLQVQKLTLSDNRRIYMGDILIHDGISGKVHDSVGFEHLLGVCPSVRVLSSTTSLITVS